jgi:hypothetical protein
MKPKALAPVVEEYLTGDDGGAGLAYCGHLLTAIDITVLGDAGR